ncbi:MAG TPA: hypothetical protein VJU16_07020, partial [Planctomycetota bacterium]|nr:hypothetical protein [Planctomycetota bacterium]
MKKSLLLYQGKAAQAQGGGRFAKDVLRVGRWTHPVTGQEVVVDQARLSRLAESSNKYLRHVDRERIPYPDGHSFSADKNLGWWPGPFFVVDDKLFSVVEPTDQATAKKMEDGSIAAVSAMIEFGRSDTKGNRYDEVITHICATPYPVIDGQSDFVKLSAETTEGEVFIPQELAGTSPEGNRNRTEGRMDLKALAKALGLPEATPADKILEAAEKAGQASAKLSSIEGQQTAVTSALKGQGLEWKDGKL